MTKNVRLPMLLGLSLIGLAILCSNGWGATAPGPAGRPRGATKNKMYATLNTNAWSIYATNYGPFVFPRNNAPGGYWSGAGYNYIYGGGLWVGGIDSLDSARVAIGYYPNNGGSEFCPVNPFTYDWVNGAVDPQARLYLSTNQLDLSEWPLRDAQNRPVVKSVQDGYTVYSDENPAFTFTGETRIGVRIKQWSYAWNFADNNDIVFFYFRAINVSGDSLRNLYIGPCFDADIGDESGTAANDRTDFDYTRNLAIQFQSDPEAGWPRVGQFGCRYFESPLNNTGQVVHVTDNQFPHDIQPGQPLGMTAFKIFTIDIDPPTDADRYLMIEGYNYRTMFMDAYDEWGATTPGDKRFVMSSGPFHMANGDSASTCVGVMCAWDRSALLTVSDVAQEIYNNHFQLAVPPATPVLTTVAGDRCAYISWTRIAETAPDPYWANIDSVKRWYTYFKGTYYAYGKARVDTMLIDSLIIKTGASTYVAIPRGAANPSGGTDTLEAFYNQQAMYSQYDFQGYLLYRAATQEALLDPSLRTPVGTLYDGTSGARGYFYDRNDGVQIVLDLVPYAYPTPDTTYYLPKYDTIGTDRGLACALVDTGLNNGQAYFYGLSAYDYQPSVYFTKKCPTTLSTNPFNCSAMVIPQGNPPGYVPPNIVIRVDGDCDARYGGALDHFQNLAVANPPAVPADSFKIFWQEVSRTVSGSYRLPFYKGKLYGSSGAYLDSIGIVPEYGLHQGIDPASSFFGTPYDQLAFGGIVFQPFVKLAPWLCQAESLAIIAENPGGSRTYPADSVRVRLDATTWAPTVAQWMWRGSDYEIRWRDTLVRVGGATADSAALTCSVWDVTNNLEIPFQGGLAKANMTKQAWCFNPTANATTNTLPYIYNRSSVDNFGIFICGVTVYFNKHGVTLRRMDWANRPETGDLWQIDCSGSVPPVDGNVTTFILSPAVTGVAGGPSIQPLAAMLQQNAPNPFSGITEISYQISQPGRVQLKVYNIAGQLVKILLDGQKAPNRYSVRWDGRNDAGQKLSAGVYLYRLRAGEKTVTRKLVLVR